ncbi:MAG: hypothetical protein GC164_08010 [Phycisphaera sp.]|nr:hypothetical protein [Phycisphaera sp.]
MRTCTTSTSTKPRRDARARPVTRSTARTCPTTWPATCPSRGPTGPCPSSLKRRPMAGRARPDATNPRPTHATRKPATRRPPLPPPMSPHRRTPRCVIMTNKLLHTLSRKAGCHWRLARQCENRTSTALAGKPPVAPLWRSSVLITAVLFALSAQALAVAPPDQEVEQKSCVTAECHTGVKDHREIHGPVNVNACDACHTVSDVKTHKFTLARKPEELCTFCHVIETKDATSIHEPLKKGQCLSCHDPHGGFDKGFLKGKSTADLCQQCHADTTAGKSHIHGPVAAGACVACHTPHTSTHKKLLVETGQTLCLNCHQEMGKQLEKVRFKHKAVEDDCTNCHDPHASNYKMQVKAPPMQLCTDTCHADVKKAVTTATHKHSAVTQDSACANCHNPHGSDLARLMKSKPVEICLTCHDKPLTTPEGEKVASVKEIAAPNLIKHGPVADGSCGGCHNVHGSDVTRLLKDPYPESFYAPFKESNYALCFECHDKQLVELETTSTLTGFRNGDKSLHYVHVNKADRGRTCRACHSTHASTNPVHIRESVPYGNWELPINYTKTEHGGSCAPGCHQQLSYDRDNPVPVNKPEDDTKKETPDGEQPKNNP